MKATIYRNASREAFLLILTPVILFLLMYGCNSNDTGIIDPSLEIPYILLFTVSPEEIDTDTVVVEGSDIITVSWNYRAEIETRGVSDMNIRYKITGPQSSTPVEEGFLEELKNSQLEIVSLAGELSASFPRVFVGTQTISIFAETPEGYTSNQIKQSVRLVRVNEPPEIVNVEAPDTVDTAAIDDETIIIFRVFVDDPNGVDDVIRVSSYNVQPDNEVRTIPDLIREEQGVFRIDIPFPSDAKIGTHRFHFTAYDRMNEASEEYIHEMAVK